MPSPLASWLSSLDADRLAEILARRPEALRAPAARTLSALAARLQEHEGVAAALRQAPLPAVQLIEVMQALDGPAVDRDRLAATIGHPPDDPDLIATLAGLAERALVWTDGDRLRMAGPLWSAFEYPLNLGGPARRLLDGVPAAQIRAIADRLGLRGRGRAELLAMIVARLADPDFVRALVAGAPSGARELLVRLATHGPLLLAETGVRTVPDLAWAVDRGLLVYDGWRYAQLVGEVGRALRGPRWHAPFAGPPPAVPRTDVDPGAVDLRGAAAAAAAVQQVAALLEHCAQTPVALLKAGGVGSRELKRLSKAIGDDIPRVRLWLEIGYAAGLVAADGGELLPTAAYDEWVAAEPPARLVPLLPAWLRLPAAPSTDRSTFGGDAPALTRDQLGLIAYELRPHVLAEAAHLPAGQGVADPELLAEALRWRLPLLVTGDDLEFELPTGPPLVTDAWREAGMLGLVAQDALTTLGRALVDGADLGPIATELLPAAIAEALFQADLTVVVPGAPAAPLADLLDAAADRESRGGAATWRFSAGSVRRALDAGRTAADLLAELRAVSATAVLPQPLEYLIGDVDRQHGRVRVRAVGCVLRAEDPNLLAELTGARALASLRLVTLAPTVLASARPAAETLAALRGAGYAPVGEGADGAPLIERAPARRAPAGRSVPPLPRPGQSRRTGRGGDGAGGSSGGEDLRSVAAALLAAPIEPPPPPAPAARVPATVHAGGTVIDLTPRLAAALAAVDDSTDETFGVAAAVSRHASHLGPAEQLLLVTAIEGGTPVRIEYTDAGNRSSVRVIEPLELTGNRLHAWCELREDERHFSLDRIDSVLPAG